MTITIKIPLHCKSLRFLADSFLLVVEILAAAGIIITAVILVSYIPSALQQINFNNPVVWIGLCAFILGVVLVICGIFDIHVTWCIKNDPTHKDEPEAPK